MTSGSILPRTTWPDGGHDGQVGTHDLGNIRVAYGRYAVGRPITLANVERGAETVETATRMMDLGTWLLNDAYRWRASSR